MNAPESIAFLVAVVRRRLEMLFSADLAPHGVSPKQYAVLARLWREDDRTVGDLARALYTDQASVSRLLDRMERQGFLARRPDPADRRVMRVRLDARGAALRNALRSCSRAANERLVRGMTSVEVRTLRALLERMIESLGAPDAIPPDIRPAARIRKTGAVAARSEKRSGLGRNPRRKI